MGVAQRTVSDWLGTTNSGSAKGCPPDSRVRIPADAKEIVFDRIEAGETQTQVAADYGVTKQAVQKIHATKKAKKKRAKHRAAALPKDTYRIVYADPPWKYDFSETDSRDLDERQYPTRSLADIISEAPKTASDSVLFLWATAPKLLEALEVLEAWGFTYVTHAVWDKGMIGMGYWFRGQHELLLVGKRGKFPPPAPKNRVASVLRHRRGRHSEKPEIVRELIEEWYPGEDENSRLVMYSRKEYDGWTCWGHIK